MLGHPSPSSAWPPPGDFELTIATAPYYHWLFDLLAWAGAALLARRLHLWRLHEFASASVERLGTGYGLALALGVAARAWGFGSLNAGLSAIPHPSQSIAGGLAGGIIAVELYKWAKRIRRSTGALWVGPLALG